MLGAAAVIAVLWWWWPTLARDPERTDVLVVGDGQLAQARDPIERRLRERGLSVAWRDAGGTWCEAVEVATAARAELEPDVVVLSVRDDASACAELVELHKAALGELVLVIQPGPPGEGQPVEVQQRLRAITAGAVLADPTNLLGTEGARRLPCQWWDDCEPDGTVSVRDDSGSLTPAGGERVARVIAAVVPWFRGP